MSHPYHEFNSHGRCTFCGIESNMGDLRPQADLCPGNIKMKPEKYREFWIQLATQNNPDYIGNFLTKDAIHVVEMSYAMSLEEKIKLLNIEELWRGKYYDKVEELNKAEIEIERLKDDLKSAQTANKLNFEKYVQAIEKLKTELEPHRDMRNTIEGLTKDIK